MMYCSKCGRKLRDDEVFCSKCGNKIIREDVNNNDLKPESTSASIPEVSVEKSIKKPRSQLKTWLFKGILIAVAVCALLEIVFILTGEIWQVHTKVLASIGWIVVYGIMANVAVNYYEATKYKNIGLVIFALITSNFILSTLLTWGVITTSDKFVYKLVATIWIIFGGVVHSAFLSLIDFKNDNCKRTWNLTNIAIAITYSMGILKVIFEIDIDLFFRLFWVSVIITLFGTVATPLVNKITKPSAQWLQNNQQVKKNNKNKKWVIIAIFFFFGPSIISSVFLGVMSLREHVNSAADKRNTISVPYAKVKIEGNTLIIEDMVAYKDVPKSIIDERPNLVLFSSRLIGKYVKYDVTIPQGGYFYETDLTILKMNKYQDVCTGQPVALTKDMIISMTHSASGPNDSYFTINKEELKKYGANSDFGIVIIGNNRITIKTGGCKIIKGTLIYNDKDNSYKPEMVTAFYKEDIGVCGSTCPNEIGKYIISHGKSIDFEISIENTRQIVIQNIISPYHPSLALVGGNIYFE